ncbi:bidirectional sugar transporter SWEET4-like [Cucurbita pepo subsp. pepo]|uniref:bidirectional sugar transporter SWEET4-like n=1 Tax=Cucurbita pepo subsp. pepo TaxID=3664 RepID=UPI000C9D7477|nr:bidirectional sugar transporter SWEET4-like [Cucurbita pepo subsp. pepo]XP_023550520.1 bidirectional sugar transporter SWEET4-like [Cucurbita pepo subsp. pepo]
MVSPDAVRTVLGICGNVISFFLFLSPLPTFIKICKKKSVEQYSPMPYLATLMNCLVWTLYGMPMVHPNSLLVITINGIGIVIELVYIVLFLVYCNGRKERVKVVLVVLAEVVFVAFLTLLVLTLAHTYTLRSTIVGSVCLVFNIMMYASPLTVMKLVIKTKSVEYMPFTLSFVSLANGIIWTAYACINFDPFIVIPNSLGTLSSLVQLILYATFYKSTQIQIADRKAQIHLSEVVIKGDSLSNKTTDGRDATSPVSGTMTPPHKK